MPHNGCAVVYERRRNDIMNGARPACSEAIRTILQYTQRGTMIIPNDFNVIQENIAKSIALFKKNKKNSSVVISRMLAVE